MRTSTPHGIDARPAARHGLAAPLHVPWLTGGLVVLALPPLFFLLLALADGDLMARLGNRVTASQELAPWVGRSFILWMFNFLLVAGAGWALDRRGAGSWQLHGLLLLAAVTAVASPAAAIVAERLPFASPALRVLAAVAAGALAQAALWAEVFLVTGVLLDALHGRRPTLRSCARYWRGALGRGAVFGAVCLLLVHGATAGAQWASLMQALHAYPLAAGAVLGAGLFPLARTLVETFDGSAAFLSRLARAYADAWNAARGGFAGAALGWALANGLPGWSGTERFLAGLAVGALAYAGVDLLRDLLASLLGRRRRLETVRAYGLGFGLGGFVAGALAWYFDSTQVAVVAAKLQQYALHGTGQAGAYVVYPLFSKWGAIDLGPVTSGVRLLWAESMAGVINWAIAAPLFAANMVVLVALFRRSFAPLQELFSRAGLVSVLGHTIRVLRWGPWMAPIIFTFLRLSPEPAWYNQDGLVRTFVVIWQDFTLAPEAFRLWSLECFLGLLAYDWLRLLIWFDHMGLRVATLVNLSFVGGDVLDEKAARFVGHSARARVVPEGIRRFFTWAPLLLPFYIPRGSDWDYAWSGAEAMAKDSSATLLPAVEVLVGGYALAGAALAMGAAAILALRGRLDLRTPPRARPAFACRLDNGQYTLELDPDGSGYSHVESELHPGLEVDLTRRPDDPLELRGKWFWIQETPGDAGPRRAWSLTSLPSAGADVRYGASRPRPSCVRFVAERGDLRVQAHVEVAPGRPLEEWTIRLRNAGPLPRVVEVTSYRELAMAPTDSYRRSPVSSAMHVRTSFVRALGALLAQNRRLPGRRGRSSPEVAFHAVDADGQRVRLLGYEDSRCAFIGGGTLRHPDVLAGHPLRTPEDEGSLHTFDPVASLRVQVQVPAGASAEVRFVEGYAKDSAGALRLIAEAFGQALPAPAVLDNALARQRTMHGASSGPAADPFSADGLELRASAEAQRPWAHVLANERGHGAIVGADGRVYSFDGNAQQNALTPFVPEEFSAQTIGQLVALVDLDSGERYSAGRVPWRRADATREVAFGLGYARLACTLAGLHIEETIVVPPDAPLLVREVRVRNLGKVTRRLRAVAYAQLVLAETAFDSLGRIEVSRTGSAVLLFRNPDNDFRKGWALAATSLPAAEVETVRSRFLGGACEAGEAHFLAHGAGEAERPDDGRRCAAFAGTLEIKPGEEGRVTFILGQAADRRGALDLARRFRNADARALAQATRAWWLAHLGTLRVQSDRPELDRLVNIWLPYQVFAARLWSRCGPQQRGGAFGFRDQLQDVLPLLWTHPGLARRQILLHAAQQFRQGDVLAWWHASWEGRTGIGARTAASDLHVWLPHFVAHYVHASGDASILQETVPFLEGRKPPRGQAGTVIAARESRDLGSVYAHCRIALDRSLRRLGAHGLPLIGSGDWNDGFDALGLRGRGESAWLGFFLHDVLSRFAPIAAAQGDAASARRYEGAAQRLREALGRTWSGDGYARAIDDSGQTLRLASCLMAAWPALSGAASEERALAALESALRALEKDRRVLLLAPPFDETSRPYPGSIAMYPPGVRENGGQYSHGASWTVDAWLHLARQATARGDHVQAAHCHARAWELWWKISPLSKTDAHYGLPPHQQPADVYDGPGYAGRGGWAWYTGAAARMLYTAYCLLGLDVQNGELRIIPPAGSAAAPRLRRAWFRGREIRAPDRPGAGDDPF